MEAGDRKEADASASEPAGVIGGVGHILRGVLSSLPPTVPLAFPTHAAAPPDALAELQEIDRFRQESLDTYDDILERVVQARHARQQLDAEHAAEVRAVGLLQTLEAPLPRNIPQPDVSPRGRQLLSATTSAAAVSSVPGRREDGIISSTALLDAVETEALLRSGNLKVGSTAPDFSRTAGKPHYLTDTSSGRVRTARNAERYTTTLGGFGADFHRTASGRGVTGTPSAAPRGGAPAPDAQPAMPPSATGDASGGWDLDAELARHVREDEGYAGADAVSPRAVVPVDDLAASSPTSRAPRVSYAPSVPSSAAGERASPTRRRTLAAAGAAVLSTDTAAAALNGTRGEGLAAALAKQASLTNVRRTATNGVPRGTSVEDAKADARIAARMKHTQSFLKNPRFGRPSAATSVGGGGGAPAATLGGAPPSTAQTGAGEMRVGTFVLTPAVCEWTSYEVGESTSVTVTLRNVDSVSRAARILPPRTRFFTLDRLAYPAGVATTTLPLEGAPSPPADASSLIAPGMAVKLVITFTASSLAPYSDELTVVTDTGAAAVLPLVATLPSPELNLARELPLGQCLPFDVIRQRVSILNAGGAAAFRCVLLPAHLVYEPHITLEDVSDALLAQQAGARAPDDAPFDVSPAEFALGLHESSALTFTFRPMHEGQYVGRLAIVYSNGDLTLHTLTASCSPVKVGISSVGGVPCLQVDTTTQIELPGIAELQHYENGALPVHAPGLFDARSSAQSASLLASDASITTVPPMPPPSTAPPEADLALALSEALQRAWPPHEDGAPPSAPAPAEEADAEAEENVVTVPAPLQLRFEDTQPFRAVTQAFTVSNATPMGLRFRWHIEVDTSLGASAPADAAAASSVDVRDVFSIEPATGTLAPAAETMFVATFRPETVGTARVRARCEILDVPVDAGLVERLLQSRMTATRLAERRARMSLGAYRPTATKLIADTVPQLTPAMLPPGGLSDTRALVTDDLMTALSHDAAAGHARSPSRGTPRPHTAQSNKQRSPSRTAFESPTVAQGDDEDAEAAALARGDDAGEGGGEHSGGGGTLVATAHCCRIAFVGTAVVGRVTLLPGAQLMGDATLPGVPAYIPFALINNSEAVMVYAVTAPAHVALRNGVLLPPAHAHVAAVPADGEEHERSASPMDVFSEVQPAFGVLPPHTRVAAQLVATSYRPGTYVLQVCLGLWHVPEHGGDDIVAHVTHQLQLARSAGGSPPSAVPPDLLHALRRQPAAGELHLSAEVSVEYPHVRFEQPLLDFGLLSTMASATARILLVNDSACPAPFVLTRTAPQGERVPCTGSRVHAGDADAEFVEDEAYVGEADGATAQLSCEPWMGVLEPGGSMPITVTCATGSSPERLRAILRCLVGAMVAPPLLGEGEEGDAAEGSEVGHAPSAAGPRIMVLTRYPAPPRLYLRTTAEVQVPTVTLSVHQMSFGVAFVNVPLHRAFQLHNISNLPASFAFDGYVGVPRDASWSGTTPALTDGGSSSTGVVANPKYTVEFKPEATGALQAKEDRTLQLVITPRRIGKLDAIMACDVHGMPYALGFRVGMLVWGVTVAFTAMDDYTGRLLPHAGSVAHAPSHITLPSSASPLASGSSVEEGGASSPGAAGDGSRQATTGLDEDARFAASIAAVDPELRTDPAVLAMEEAFAKARRAGARVASVPPLNFGSEVPVRSRRTLTLRVYNLSGIPTDALLQMKKYPAWEGDAPEGGLNFPALYGEVDDLVAHADRAFSRHGAWREQVEGAPGAPAKSASRPSWNGPRAASVQFGAGRSERRVGGLTAAAEARQRFASKAGAGYIADQEAHKLMDQSLGLGHGVAFEIYPKRLQLPPFGVAAVQVAVVSDMPGRYEDTLILRMDGVPDMHVPVSVCTVGNPLCFSASTSGLQLGGAAGAEGPTLNFGMAVEGGKALEKRVWVDNTSPMDAHLVWHLLHDRHPAAAPPPCQLAIDVRTNSDGSLDAGGRWVDVLIDVHSDRGPRAPPPFAVSPTVFSVPAHSKRAITVSATPAVMDDEYEALAEAMGWPADLRGAWRARLVADVVWSAPGTPPSPAALSNISDAVTPRDRRQAALDTPPEVDACGRAPYKRDALTLHTVIRPFAPQLTVDKRALGDGLPYVKFTVWSLAFESSRHASIAAGGGLLAVRNKLAASSTAAGGGDMTPSATLQGGALPPGLHPSCVRELTLTNDAATDLTFLLSAEGPFQLLACHSNAPKHPVTRLEALRAGMGGGGGGGGGASPEDANSSLLTLFAPGVLGEFAGDASLLKRIFNLPPRCSVRVEAAFNPEAGQSLRETAAALFFSKNVAAQAGMLTATTLAPRGSGSDTGGGAQSIVQRTTRESMQKVKGEMVGALRVTFANGRTQRVGLHAQVLRPALIMSVPVLRFGVVRVTSSKAAGVTLSNATVVDAHWTLKHVPTVIPSLPATARIDTAALGLAPHRLWDTPPPAGSEAVDDPSVFTFSSTQGVVAGPTLPPHEAEGAPLRASPDVPQPMQLSITFAPKAAVLYSCRFRLAVRQGESCEIVCVGSGSFAENV